MFVELTSENNDWKQLVNLERVDNIYQVGNTTFISFQGEDYLTVKESYEEIKSILMERNKL